MLKQDLRFCVSLWVILFLSLLMSASAFSKDKMESKPLFDKKWALEMGIANLTPVSFNGASLAIRKNYSHNRAFRIGFGVDINRNFQGSEDYNRERITNDRNLYLFFHKIYSKRVTKISKMQFTFGPYFGRDRHSNHLISATETEIVTKRYYVGLHLMLGFEFKALSNLSLMCDIGPNIKHTWTKVTRESDGYLEVDSRMRRFEFDLAWPRLGIAFYF